VAEGATILTHNNNEKVLEELLSGPRTLTGDSLSKVTDRRQDVVTASAIATCGREPTARVVELHRVPNEHSDGMLIVYLPAEKTVWSADVTAVNPNPAQLGVLESNRRDDQQGEARLQRMDPRRNPSRILTKPADTC
jgi:hypothetical protein